MNESLVVIERPLEGCTRITLNRPASKNALSRALRRELTNAIDELNADKGVRVVILTGAGDAFCAGLDLKELGAASSSDVLGFDERALNPIAALAEFSKPIIGAINGPAITGGFELALACDILVCSSRARFADTHARVGIMPSWGLSQRLSRVVGLYRAKEISLTGNFVTAERAAVLGFVNRVVEPEKLMTETIILAEEMLSVAPHMLAAYKKLIDEGFELPLHKAMALEAETAAHTAKGVSMPDVEQRRRDVLARAKIQNSK